MVPSINISDVLIDEKQAGLYGYESSASYSQEATRELSWGL
jgi:hypothetical protein